MSALLNASADGDAESLSVAADAIEEAGARKKASLVRGWAAAAEVTGGSVSVSLAYLADLDVEPDGRVIPQTRSRT